MKGLPLCAFGGGAWLRNELKILVILSGINYSATDKIIEYLNEANYYSSRIVLKSIKSIITRNDEEILWSFLPATISHCRSCCRKKICLSKKRAFDLLGIIFPNRPVHWRMLGPTESISTCPNVYLIFQEAPGFDTKSEEEAYIVEQYMNGNYSCKKCLEMKLKISYERRMELIIEIEEAIDKCVFESGCPSCEHLRELSDFLM